MSTISRTLSFSSAGAVSVYRSRGGHHPTGHPHHRFTAGGAGSGRRGAVESGEDRWWVRSWKKMREWSEIVAGPRWKTFIRRFRKNRRQGNFGYDPLSYAMNFDEGQTGNYWDEDYGFRDFSSRYAAIPASAKSSMDLGKDGPSFLGIRRPVGPVFRSINVRRSRWWNGGCAGGKVDLVVVSNVSKWGI
ncbi:hypothetical protein Ancab_001542 [Ancistrocladus abbreviatus]